jgi:hypothetical protein
MAEVYLPMAENQARFAPTKKAPRVNVELEDWFRSF